MHNCQVCGKPDNKKPMCFRGEDWCCELHRKMIVGEIALVRQEDGSLGVKRS